MSKIFAHTLTLVALSGVVACGSVDEPMDGADAGTTEEADAAVDTTAPTIVSTSPEAGAVGQAADVAFSITFSEPMDQASVEGTLDASALGASTISWNGAGDTITVTPNAPLEYATGLGDDPSTVTAKRYTVNLGSAALDVAGNPLGDGIQVQFDTLKAMESTVGVNDALTRIIDPQMTYFDVSFPLAVGDSAANMGIRSTITLDLSSLPASAAGVQKATLATRQLVGNNQGAPYALGTQMNIDHVTFVGLGTENEINAAFNSSQVALASHTGFSAAGQVVIEFDVTADVDDDLANRAARLERSQFLLYFDTPTDVNGMNDYAVISRDLLELQVTYLAP